MTALADVTDLELRARINRAWLLADELQAASEDVAIYLAASVPTDDDGSEYRRRAARREAAHLAVMEAIARGAS